MATPSLSRSGTLRADSADAYFREETAAGTLGHRPAEGGGAAPRAPGHWQHNFWDPQIAPLRAVYFRIMIPATVLMIVVMWLFLPVYWGSLGELNDHVPNLNGWFINRDGDGALGQAMLQAFQDNSAGVGVPKNQHLTWIVMDPGLFSTDEDVINGVVGEEVWTAVVVEAGATSSLVNARATGNASYNPLSAVTFYWNQGRNEVAANSYINPLTTALIQGTLLKFNAQFNAQWLSTASLTDLAAATKAPQTVTSPFGMTSNNLRPFTKTVTTAILLVGQIYITIFAFVIAMGHDAARGVVAPYLKFRSYAKIRIVVPMIAYIPLSFSYSMISLPFKVSFGERYGYGGGFFIFWLYIYMGMAALGLSVEAMLTILTPKFISNFLLALIIFNVSTGSVPIILQPGFYRYGYGFPINNLSQAIRTIVFNTKSHLGRNAGVLIAWIILSCFTITIFTWYTSRYVVRKQTDELKAEEGAKESE